MWLCAAPILYPFPVRVLTAKNNSHYLLITLTFYQPWVAGVHAPQLKDSCQSAVRAWWEGRGGWRSSPRRCSPQVKRPSLWAALLPPHLCYLPDITGKRLTVALHRLLSCLVCRRQAKITADTCQAIPPQGQRLTDSNKLLRTMDLRHMQTCNQCHTAAFSENWRWSCWLCGLLLQL